MAISVASLIDRAKGLADKRADLSVPDTDWLVYVNWSVLSLDRLIASLDPWFRFAQSDFTLTGTAAGAKKTLSTLTWTDIDGVTTLGTYTAFHGLDKDPDTVQRRTIPRRNFRERNQPAVGWWTPAIYATDIRYDLRGKTVVLTPYEQAAGNYRAYSRLGPYLFVSTVDANPLDYQLEPYDEWLSIMTARKGLGVEESDTGLQSERLAELREEIISEHSRDDGSPVVIADVEADDVGWTRGW